MLAKRFSEFYQPFFYGSGLNVISALDVEVDQAETYHYMARFDFSHIDDIPIAALIKQHTKNLPRNTVFISSGHESDLLDKTFRPYFAKLRPDISFVKPYHAITQEWLELAANKYLCSNPWTAHVLFTMYLLNNQGKVAGVLGPFIETKTIIDRIVIQDFYDTVPIWLYGMENATKVVPNFTLPFAKAFVKSLSITEHSKYCPDRDLFEIVHGKPATEELVMDKSTGVWYSQLLNRNAQSPSYHSLREFQ